MQFDDSLNNKDGTQLLNALGSRRVDFRYSDLHHTEDVYKCRFNPHATMYFT